VQVLVIVKIVNLRELFGMDGPVLEVLNDCILITNEKKYDQNDQIAVNSMSMLYMQ